MKNESKFDKSEFKKRNENLKIMKKRLIESQLKSDSET